MLMRCECEQCGTPLLVDSDRAGSVLRCVECWSDTTVVEADASEPDQRGGTRTVVSSWPPVVRRSTKSLLPLLLPVLAVALTIQLVASDFWGLLTPGESPNRRAARAGAPEQPEPAPVVLNQAEGLPEPARIELPRQPIEVRPSRSDIRPQLDRTAKFATSEDEVLRELAAAPEVGLTRDAERWLANRTPVDSDGKHALETLLAKSEGLMSDLPFRFGEDCRTDEQRAADLERCADLMRPLLQSQNLQSLDPFLADRNFLEPVWLPAFAQMFPAEPMNWRLAMVNRLTIMPAAEAGRLLAERAVFDPSHIVRNAAVRALRDRPVGEYSDVLLRAFRHPWATAARHAAQAVVELRPTAMEAPLRALVDLPDPAAPRRRILGGQERYVVPTLVRVNHLKNCLACHQRSVAREGRVVASAPSWDMPLTGHYGSRNGSAFVRADVTYLRQDFSAKLPVADRQFGWPTEQRFDFFVGLRPVSDEERREIDQKQRTLGCSQRNSLRLALQSLARR
jgi:hypothetical protein